MLLGLDVEGAQLLPLLAIGLVLIGYATGPLVVTRALPDVPGVAASSIALVVTAVVYAPFAAAAAWTSSPTCRSRPGCRWSRSASSARRWRWRCSSP